MKAYIHVEELEVFSVEKAGKGRSALTTYEISRKLFQAYEKALDRLNELESEIAYLVDSQDEERRLEQAIRDNPGTTVYQLRQVRSGLVIVEATTPRGSVFSYDFERGREPEGVLRWYYRHSNAAGETGFEPLAGSFIYVGGRAEYVSTL